MRRHYVQHPKTGRLVPHEEVDWPRYQTKPRRVEIMPDIEPFVSPVDGTVVSSRSRLREHNKRNDVVQFHEMDGEWERAAARRQAIAEGRDKTARAERVQDIINAIDKVQRGEGHGPGPTDQHFV